MSRWRGIDACGALPKGEEFDWFAVDARGCVGHFSTAGFGPLPSRLLERLDGGRRDAVWNLGARILALPVIGTATVHLRGERGDWLAQARRGLFSYDWRHWKGPYRRAATPDLPVLLEDLPSDIRELLGLVTWPELRFARERRIRPERLEPCG